MRILYMQCRSFICLSLDFRKTDLNKPAVEKLEDIWKLVLVRSSTFRQQVVCSL